MHVDSQKNGREWAQRMVEEGHGYDDLQAHVCQKLYGDWKLDSFSEAFYLGAQAELLTLESLDVLGRLIARVGS